MYCKNHYNYLIIFKKNPPALIHLVRRVCHSSKARWKSVFGILLRAFVVAAWTASMESNRCPLNSLFIRKTRKSRILALKTNGLILESGSTLEEIFHQFVKESYMSLEMTADRCLTNIWISRDECHYPITRHYWKRTSVARPV